MESVQYKVQRSIVTSFYMTPEPSGHSRKGLGNNLARNCLAVSLVPRPFPPPVFDRLQYTKTEGEGLEKESRV